MTIQLPIDDLIVPAEVQRANLEPYENNPAFLQTIEDVFTNLKKQQVSKITDAPTPGASVFDLVTGSHGVGKSHLKLNREAVVCDVDAILPEIPGFKEAFDDLPSVLQQHFYEGGNDYSTDAHRAKIEEITERFRPAAKYINDRLMTEAVREGYPVIVETNAKTPHIGNFMDNIKATGVILHTHICQAPLSIKQAGFQARYDISHDIGISAEQIKAEHEAMTKNMKTIAAKADGNLTIHWRQDANAPLKPAAVATGKEYTRDEVAYTGFNAYFIDHGICIKKLMGARTLKNEANVKQDSAPSALAMAV